MMSLDEYNKTYAQLKRDVQEAIAEVERGDFMGIDKAFEEARKPIVTEIVFSKKAAQNLIDQALYIFEQTTERRALRQIFGLR